MKENVTIIAITGIICLVLTAAFVESGMCQGDETKTNETTSPAAQAKAKNPIRPVTKNDIAFTGGPSEEAMNARPPFKVKVNNTICPVTGNTVNMDNPVTVEYNGKIYNLCCSMCPATFKSNPEKYSKIAEEQAKGVSK